MKRTLILLTCVVYVVSMIYATWYVLSPMVTPLTEYQRELSFLNDQLLDTRSQDNFNNACKYLKVIKESQLSPKEVNRMNSYAIKRSEDARYKSYKRSFYPRY